MATLPNLTYGVELEVITSMSRYQVAETINRAGVECRDVGYDHAARSFWKVVSDASVSGGCEIVSPILRGQDGLDQLAKVCKALESAGVTVNKTCGFHVHVGARELSQSVLGFQNLARQWVKWESHLDRIVAPSRRGNENRYCMSNVTRIKMNNPRLHNLADIFGAINKCTSVAAVVALLNGTDSWASRYHKLNLQALYRHNTVEVRMHQGTIDAEKACQWVRVCLDIVWDALDYANKSKKIGGSNFATWERFLAGLASSKTRKWATARAEKFGTLPAEVA